MGNSKIITERQGINRLNIAFVPDNTLIYPALNN